MQNVTINTQTDACVNESGLFLIFSVLSIIQDDTKKRKLVKCVVAAMYSWQHCGTGSLRYRQPRHLVIMDQWNGQQRAVAIKMFYMFLFLQYLLGFSKVLVFLCHLVFEFTVP
jgi:hypothetical protein